MVRTLTFAALGMFAMSAVAARAQTTPAPPDWQDGRGTSVYLNQQPQQSPAADATAEANRYSVGTHSADKIESTEPAPLNVAPVAPPRIDSAVIPAAYQEPAAPAGAIPPAAAVPAEKTPTRYLAPPSHVDDKLSDSNGRPRVGGRQLTNFGLPVQSIYTVVTGLAIVIGSFLLFTWVLRRGNRKAGANGMLPSEAVSVLGRVPIAPRQFAELLRVGNKLVLVALTPAGPVTLTEIIDPVEVDRLVGVCQQSNQHSTTKAFEQVFQQFQTEPTGGGFLETDPLPTSFSSPAVAYRSQRGGGARA